jgi:hypothetical protein
MAARLRKVCTPYFWLLLGLVALLLVGLWLLAAGYLNGAPPYPAPVAL